MSQDAFRRPPTAQQAVLSELRRLISGGAMRPGERIVQDALAEQLGVSRVPLREALKILEGEGVVEYVAHRGYVVARLSLSDLLEVYRIRQILETEAVRLAAPVMTAEDIERFQEGAVDVERASAQDDITTMARVNRIFHLTLIEASASPRLIRIVQQLWDATEVYRSVYYADESAREQVLVEHRQLVDAVLAKDVDRICHVLDVHRQHAIDALRPVLLAADDAGADLG